MPKRLGYVVHSSSARVWHDGLMVPGRIEAHDLASAAVGDTFRVLVAHCGEDPRSILLATDANGLFGLTVGTVQLMQLMDMVPPTIVVGVGYPGFDTLAETIGIRTRDLTPSAHPLFERSGGAPRFLTFLGDELTAWLGVRFAPAVEDMTYFGSSLGGLFGTYCLLTRPEIFGRYILASPSLWWDDELVFRLEEQRAATATDLPAQVFFGIGSEETDEGRRVEACNLPDGHPAKPPAVHLDMVDDVDRFHRQLSARGYLGLDLALAVIADEYHVTVPGAVLSRGLRMFHHEPFIARTR